MKLTIIPSDGAVYKDGLCYMPLTWAGTPQGVHAFQWLDTQGWIEFTDPAIPNETITSIPAWADNAMTAWQVAYDEAHKPPVPPTPTPVTEVSMRQARLALYQNGLLNQVQVAIDAMTDPAKTENQITWDYATVVNRNDVLVTQLASQLGLTSTDLDNLFTLAATL